MSELILYMQIGESPYRQFIQENLNEIQSRFRRSQTQFVFLPALREKRSVAFDDQLQQYLELYYPGYRLLSVEQQIQVLYIISSTAGEQSVYTRIQEMFGFHLSEGAYLCYLNEKSSRIEKLPSELSPKEGISKFIFREENISYSIPPAEENPSYYAKSERHSTQESLSSQLRNLASNWLQLRDNDDFKDDVKENVKQIPLEKHHIDDDFVENHDKLFDEAVISEETQRLLDTVNALKLETGLRDLIGIILKNYAKELSVANDKSGLHLTYGQIKNIDKPVDSIRFNFEGHLFVGDREVPLNPICRALYKLFLNHPEGIELRNMGNYYEELHRYYANLATHTDHETLISRVKLLCNPLDNSINEKISKINKTFKLMLGDDYCMPYQILGVRGEAKKITLRREFQDTF